MLASGSDDGTVQLWGTATYTQSTKLQGQKKKTVNAIRINPVVAIDFSPTSEKVASGLDDGTIRVWNTTSGHLLLTLEGHKDSVTSIAFSPISQVLASGSDDRTVRVWDITSGKILWTLEGHKHPIRTIAFSATEPVLASGSNSGAIRAWNPESGKNLSTSHAKGVNLQFSSIAVFGKTILACAIDDEAPTYCYVLSRPVDGLGTPKDRQAQIEASTADWDIKGLENSSQATTCTKK